MSVNVLLVEPEFPIPSKSKNHRDFLPIGLLKLASYHREHGDRILLMRGNQDLNGFKPDQIKITSLFTYWSKYVWDSVNFYKHRYPDAKVTVGGIYASLMPEHCKESKCDEGFVGVDDRVERCRPAYDLVDVDYQILHTSRGCIRRCDFCGTWKIEPKFTPKKSIKDEIYSNWIIFYDNNLLANPYIEDILNELTEARHNGKVVYSESQCGIDGRLLTPSLASLLKRARFINPRIAWDYSYSQHRKIKRQLDILTSVGYNPRDIYVFMIYNWNHGFHEMEKKRLKCWEWKVQIADCRYRPLNQTYDNYDSLKEQTRNDYYIHPNWTDNEVKQFRRNVRRQNICVRHRFSCYNRVLERKSSSTTKDTIDDLWCPDKITMPLEHALC